MKKTKRKMKLNGSFKEFYSFFDYFMGKETRIQMCLIRKEIKKLKRREKKRRFFGNLKNFNLKK